MESKNSEYQVFNYSDIFFSHYSDDRQRCTKMVKDIYLVYIYSGEYILEEGKKKVVVNPGECVFLRRDNRVNMIKQPKGDQPFQAVFMMFKRNFLRELYQKINKRELPPEVERPKVSVIKLPQSADITSLFQSLVPYFDPSVKPSEEMMHLKLLEGVYSLLNIDEKFYPSLFDFTEPWKIDILDFMEKNYMFDLTIGEIAGFTGRSLATFKRDFKKISNLSPEKWLINKRLKVAHDKIRNDNRKISDVYLEVGFKNLSHFSTAFKKQFGYSPTNAS